LYLQTYPILEDDKRNHAQLLKRSLKTVRATPKAKREARAQAEINQALLDEVIRNPRAVATPVTQPNMTLQTYLDRATRVQNILPFNATWEGDMEGQLTAAEVLKLANKESDPAR
jgi:L,D-transpeptidase ErfK/SrfK